MEKHYKLLGVYANANKVKVKGVRGIVSYVLGVAAVTCLLFTNPVIGSAMDKMINEGDTAKAVLTDDSTIGQEYRQFAAVAFKPQIAYVNADDVALRSGPSSISKVIRTLKRDSALDAVAMWCCDDKNACVINTEKLTVDYNGQSIELSKGQPVTIIGGNGDMYQCRLNLEGSSAMVYVNKANVKKLYGEAWYKVQLADGTIGWVYKDFITLKSDI
jgi:hypothetical protein